jgi:hypothetical protein
MFIASLFTINQKKKKKINIGLVMKKEKSAVFQIKKMATTSVHKSRRRGEKEKL